MSSTLADGAPLTEHANGDGTQTASYTLPLTGVFVVESVVAEVDASGSGDVTPTVTIADKSGQVIARKRQGEAITGGTTPASATWALRLADDGGGGAVGGLGKTEYAHNTGTVVGAGGFATLDWTGFGGDTLLDYTVPSLPTFVEDGNYGLTGTVDLSPVGAPTAGRGSLVQLALLATGGGPGIAESDCFTTWPSGGFAAVRSPLALAAFFAKAGDTLRIQVTSGQAVSMSYDFVAGLHQLP